MPKTTNDYFDGFESVSNKRKIMNFTEMSDEEILNIVEPAMGKEYLEKVCKKYQEEKGYFSQREFVSLFKCLKEVAVVWKQKCIKAEGDFVAALQ